MAQGATIERNQKIPGSAPAWAIFKKNYFELNGKLIDTLSYFSDPDIGTVLGDIHRKTFFVFLRLSTQKESATDFMSTSAYANIIYDNFIFDVSKIVDIAALFHAVKKELGGGGCIE